MVSTYFYCHCGSAKWTKTETFVTHLVTTVDKTGFDTQTHKQEPVCTGWVCENGHKPAGPLFEGDTDD